MRSEFGLVFDGCLVVNAHMDGIKTKTSAKCDKICIWVRFR